MSCILCGCDTPPGIHRCGRCSKGRLRTEASGYLGSDFYQIAPFGDEGTFEDVEDEIFIAANDEVHDDDEIEELFSNQIAPDPEKEDIEITLDALRAARRRHNPNRDYPSTS